MDSARFHELLDRYHDGSATSQEEAELESMLAADTECRRLFVERNLMDVQLGKTFAGAMAGKPRRTLRRRRTGAPEATWAAGAIAAAVLFAALLLVASRSSSPTERKAETVRSTPEIDLEPRPSDPPPPRREPPSTPDVRAIERELEAVRREFERAPDPEPPRREPETVVPAVPTPTPPKKAETRAAVAMIVPGGQPVFAGQAVKGPVDLQFPDGTRISLDGEITLLEGKRVSVERGAVDARVTKQPPGQPLVFATPHGEAKVLGTTLRLLVEAGSTRLEVTEGRVQLKRLSDGRTVDVSTGFYAVAAAGVELVARALPITEIQLTASMGKVSGDEWRSGKDDQAVGGLLLEAASTANFAVMTLPIDHTRLVAWFAKGRSRSWVTFTFMADADTDYFVWVRGRCVAPGAPGPNRLRSDDILLEVADASFVRRPPDWKPLPDYLCGFNGYGARAGFWWSGGSHDPGNTETPIALRFKRSGRQVIRMHALETPLQIDAIWMSTTKSTRPGADELPGKR